MRRFWFFIVFIVYCLCCGCGYAFAAKSDDIAVFYPNVSEPYKTIYQEIVSGVQNAKLNDEQVRQLIVFTLEKDFDSNHIKQQLNSKGIKKVIALGRSGLKLAKLLADDFIVISGALPITPKTISGVSLIADPSYLFKYLTQVAPKITKIHIAYSETNTWLIELAKTAAKNQGYILDAKKVTSTKQALEYYQKLFTDGLQQDDAIWLPVDRVTSQDKVTLPFILEKAWAQDIVVFSSKPSHAKRGALFSIYPDNYGLGGQLYEMIKGEIDKSNVKRFSALIATLLAVNLRTAAHLGLKYSKEQQENFQLTFPE